MATLCRSVGVDQRVLVPSNTNDGDNPSQQLAPTLVGKHSSHNGTSPSCGGELCRDHRRHRVITTNTNSLYNSEKCQHRSETDSRRIPNNTLENGGEDHDNKLQPVNLLTPNDISKTAKPQLSNNSTNRSGNFQQGLLRFRDVAIGPKHITHHGDTKIDSKDIISISHEPNTSNSDSTNVIPTK
ncbi:hypothetical protein WICPIJ_002848 [Wickerhamomyces pijperi]|uniref:Uncharacterized protein n=1 Tax=Wickerhamomyces pijperi TaxID=599730 RepID=A0A9P8TPF7_WICPI|nr:hypothetical protein WICPIJ_002848 [Wickerhamomyces pijperi]